MKKIVASTLFGLGACLAPLPLSSACSTDWASTDFTLAAAGQDPTPVADSRPEVKAQLDQLAQHVDKRGKEDTQAKGAIDKLLQEFKKSGPKDREAIVKGLDRCFQAKRTDTSEGVPDNGLYVAAAVALGEMAPESVKTLMSWVGNKTHKKDVALQRMLITRLGKTRAEEGRKLLLKLLDDPDSKIMSAAAEALGEFETAELKVRKESFEELLKVLMTTKNEFDADNNDPIARERYETVAAPIVTSLKRLAKHEENDPQKWQTWWNKNKKEDWDSLGK